MLRTVRRLVDRLRRNRSRPPTTARVLVIYFLAVGAFFLLCGPITYLQLTRARSDVQRAISRLEAVRDTLSLQQIQEDAPGIVAQLNAAGQNLDSARNRMGTWWLAPIRALPLVGRQISG